MAVGLWLMSFNHLQNSFQSQTRPSNHLWMWNNKKQSANDDDESWEVRAFEEDTAGNLMGCTWPPRSYTCTFCRREFRSAQALGGHMNVHRRDRARLHETPVGLTTSDKSPTPAILIPTQELVANGLCLLYSLPNPNGDILIPTASINGANKSIDFPFTAATVSSFSHAYNTNFELPVSNGNGKKDREMSSVRDSSAIEELDLELRLGRKSPPPSPPEEGR